MSRVQVDTNVLVRLFVADDAEQHKAVAALFAAQPIRVSASVILETGWVLSKSFGFTLPEIAGAFRNLFELESVEMDPGLRTDAFLALIESGADFADAVHLASAQDALWFATFDKALIKLAADSEPPVRHP